MMNTTKPAARLATYLPANGVYAPIGRYPRVAAIAAGNNVADVTVRRPGDYHHPARDHRSDVSLESYAFRATRFAAEGVAAQGFLVWHEGGDRYVAVAVLPTTPEDKAAADAAYQATMNPAKVAAALRMALPSPPTPARPAPARRA